MSRIAIAMLHYAVAVAIRSKEMRGKAMVTWAHPRLTEGYGGFEALAKLMNIEPKLPS